MVPASQMGGFAAFVCSVALETEYLDFNMSPCALGNCVNADSAACTVLLFDSFGFLVV